MEIQFQKYHGLGNDFILIEGAKKLTKTAIKQLCHRNFGVGADGIITIQNAKYKMQNENIWKLQFYNSDGSLGGMCVNGIRCAAHLIANKTGLQTINFLTPAGIKEIKVLKLNSKSGTFRLNMGRARAISNNQFNNRFADGKNFYNFKTSFDGMPSNATFISVGNPHCVIVLNKDIYSISPSAISNFRTDNLKLFPEGINIELINLVNKLTVRQRTFERGVGETLACGSGACAVFWSLYNRKLIKRKLKVELKGGKLLLFLNESSELVLEGPAQHVFSGVLMR